ncbi:MAG: efflux RND transporter periplasmic adaptor subunit [Sumerlaeia bacterium]
MSEQHEDPQGSPRKTTGKKHRAKLIARLGFTLVFGVLLPIAILAFGYTITKSMLATPPKARRGNSETTKLARLVDVEELRSANRSVTVSAMGLVIPARQVSLQPLVAGELISVSPNLEPGGYFRQGEPVVRINPQDYELIVRQRVASVLQAKSNLDLELGQQQIARQEFELLGQEITPGDSGLILRVPQLETAKAQLEAQEAALDVAKLDVTRTVVNAPFNSIVMAEETEVGLIVNTSTRLADIVGTDQFWVEVSVPLDDIRWIQLPDKDGNGGSVARIYDDAAWSKGVYREGRVVRFTNAVEVQSRMASLLIAVEDPLSLQPENAGTPPLLLNSYVRAEIEGKTLNSVVAVNRQHLRNGNQVWLKSTENTLQIMDLNIDWKGRDEVYVSEGLTGGELVITSTLSTPVENMLLRVQPSESTLPQSENNSLQAFNEESTGSAAPTNTQTVEPPSTTKPATTTPPTGG